jgi:high-affinity nickel permease
MITEAIVSALAALVSFVGSLMPSLTIPPAVDTAVQAFAEYAPKYWELGHVLPVDVMATALLFLIGVMALALFIKITRIFASFATAGGGSAG